MDCPALDLPFDPSALTGLSRTLLESHHRNNYAGAVKRLNAIRARLRQLDVAGAPGFELNGLKREELVAANAVTLHELYFDSLGGGGRPMAPALELALTTSFGSVARWEAEFRSLGKALAGGSGWVLLCFQPRDGTLANQWGADHTCALAGAVPILALDMYEHSYHMDYGAAADRYVDAFMRNIRWARVYERYCGAADGASGALAASLDDVQGAVLLDVRRAGVYAEATEMAQGAQWRDPARIDAWSGALPADRRIVVYCVHGHEVSQATAMRLRASGADARFLRGGFDAWKAAGRPVQPRCNEEVA